MNIDSEKHKLLLSWFITQIKNLESEILAYRAVFLFADHVLHIGPELEEALTQARGSSSVHATVDRKYDGVLERLLNTIDRAELDQAFAAWMKNWKPEGPEN